MSATVSRWARRYVLVGAFALVAWQVAAMAGVGRRTEVLLALFGFVLHTVFGKAYALVPSYFERELAAPRAPAVQFPLVVAGTLGLALAALGVGPSWVESAGAVLWAGGVAVFVGTLAWTIRDNLAGAETGTGDHNAHRRLVDRLANGFVPVALTYLVVGAYATVAATTPLPTLFDGYPPRATHLLAAGTGALLVFALGFRLLPRFLVATPPTALVPVVLLSGATGPALLAVGVAGGPLLVGAAVETVAVAGFAAAYLVTFRRSSRRRIGLYGVGLGVVGGVVGAAAGASMAVGVPDASLTLAHLRSNLLGFLGLTIVGMAYQFYPPAVGTLPWSSDRAAALSLVALAGGLAVQVVGLLGASRVVPVGEVVAAAGAVLYVSLLVGTFRSR
jgi:hypothetical protein